MKVAVVGCTHGQVEKIYETLQAIETEKKCKVDLVLCCGDFQAARDEYDLKSMAQPKIDHGMQTFFKYYNGENVAPVLTILVGGNHESSKYLQELPFGGWIAPNIFYLGYAGCVNVNGLRIAGISGKCNKNFFRISHCNLSLNIISGIYKLCDYRRCHYEFSPYNEKTKRSVYHVRELEVFRLQQLSKKIDIFMSHDWPMNVDKFGDEMTSTHLVEIRPHFHNDIENNCLGSPANKEILERLMPSYWFAGHMHCRFSAVVPHSNGSKTKFLALDKSDCEERQFIEILDIDVVPEESPLSYDLEWLTILQLTQHLNTGLKRNNVMPIENGPARWNFTPTHEEKEYVLSKFDNDLVVPMNFCRATKSYAPTRKSSLKCNAAKFNPQTGKLCSILNIDDPLRLAMMVTKRS